MALYSPNITETLYVRNYRDLCVKFCQPYNSFSDLTDMEMIENTLENFEGEWSVEYVENGWHEDTFKINLHGNTQRPKPYTCTLGIVNWVAEDNAPSQEEIQAILPTFSEDSGDCIYGILTDGDYWYGNNDWDINFVDSYIFVDCDKSNWRIVAHVYRCGINEDGEPYTDYSITLAQFDVQFNWTVAE